jgi:hypothetical protein
MILSLGLGEPQYLPDSLMGRPQDIPDLRWQAFLQCFARDVTSWDVMCFFSRHDGDWCSCDDIAVELGYDVETLVDRLGELAFTRLLDERILVTGPVYRLTQRLPELRRSALCVGSEWRHGAGPVS